MIPRINISLHYGNAGHRLPPYSGCTVRTFFDRRNKLREACHKSLEVTGCVEKASDQGNRPNGFILGGANANAKGYHLGSHRAPPFFPDGKGDRSGYKRLYSCPYRDGHPNSGSHRLFSLKWRREKTLTNLSLRHRTQQHQQNHHRLRDEPRLKEPTHPCNVGPCGPCKLKQGSQGPLVAMDKSNVGDGRGVSFPD